MSGVGSNVVFSPGCCPRDEGDKPPGPLSPEPNDSYVKASTQLRYAGKVMGITDVSTETFKSYDLELLVECRSSLRVCFNISLNR